MRILVWTHTGRHSVEGGKGPAGLSFEGGERQTGLMTAGQNGALAVCMSQGSNINGVLLTRERDS